MTYSITIVSIGYPQPTAYLLLTGLSGLKSDNQLQEKFHNNITSVLYIPHVQNFWTWLRQRQGIAPCPFKYATGMLVYLCIS